MSDQSKVWSDMIRTRIMFPQTYSKNGCRLIILLYASKLALLASLCVYNSKESLVHNEASKANSDAYKRIIKWQHFPNRSIHAPYFATVDSSSLLQFAFYIIINLQIYTDRLRNQLRSLYQYYKQYFVPNDSEQSELKKADSLRDNCRLSCCQMVGQNVRTDQ